MPRVSCKVQLERDLRCLYFLHDATASSSDESDEALNFLLLAEGIQEQRYLTPRLFVPKSNWASAVLPNLSDDRFRSLLRMNRFSFDHVLGLIRNDPVFFNKSRVPQASVEHQLKYALFRMGHDGSASGFLPTATMWGISEGHVFNCTKRAIEALCRLKNDFVQWPSARARIRGSLTNNQRQDGFIGVVGKVDGTDVLHTKPGGKYEGELFFNRKKRYAMDLCAVCDSNKRFIYFLSGWPNSQHDQRIFAAGDLCRNPAFYFSPGQYLLGDSAYTNSTYLVTPYKAPHTGDPDIRRFNKRLSRIRIDIEHAISGFFLGYIGSLSTQSRLQQHSSTSFYLVSFLIEIEIDGNTLIVSDTKPLND